MIQVRTPYLLLFTIVVLTALSMKEGGKIGHVGSPIDSLTIMSYNVENLFDTIDDVRTNDDEFTPEGAKHWTQHRYRQKLKRIAQVISSVGGKYWPSIITLVEVENASVIDDLLEQTSLRSRGYKYVITNSLDPRGIDVAILYRATDVELISKREYQVDFREKPDKHSRNILELKLRLPNEDILYVYGLHLPSRREGVAESEPLRCEVLSQLSETIRGIYHNLGVEERRRTHFIMMGDFNEESEEPAMKDVLKSKSRIESYIEDPRDSLELYSLMSRYIDEKSKRQHPRGSYCYRGVWSQLDQFVVSGSLMTSRSKVQYVLGSAQNYTISCLQSDRVVAGYAVPNRTYGGNTYLGGYSDHFPIMLRLSLSY